MHGVIPYRPLPLPPPPRYAQESVLPLVTFALLPVLILVAGAAIVAHGLPTPASAKTVLELVAATPGM